MPDCLFLFHDLATWLGKVPEAVRRATIVSEGKLTRTVVNEHGLYGGGNRRQRDGRSEYRGF